MKYCLMLVAILALAGNAFAATSGTIFTDNFDNGVGSNWQVVAGTYNQNLVGDSAHNLGGQAAKQVNADPWVYYSSSTSSAFASPGLLTAGQKQIFTMYMWDDNVQSGTFAGGAMLCQAGLADFFQVLAISTQSTSKYVLRSKSNGYMQTTIARSSGWHKFQIAVDSYTGVNDVSFFIDDVLAGTGKRYSDQNLDQIRLGVSIKTPASPFWYDNVSMEVVPEPASLVAMLTGFVGAAGLAIRRRRS